MFFPALITLCVHVLPSIPVFRIENYLSYDILSCIDYAVFSYSSLTSGILNLQSRYAMTHCNHNTMFFDILPLLPVVWMNSDLRYDGLAALITLCFHILPSIPVFWINSHVRYGMPRYIGNTVFSYTSLTSGIWI